MKRYLSCIIAVLSALVICAGTAVGCKKGGGGSSGDSTSGSSGDDKIEISVTLSETSHSAVEDDIFTLTATVTPARSVKWSSSDDKIAAVSSSGRVIAKKAGSAIITAEAEGVKATCDVTVSAAAKSETYILTDKTSYLTAVGTENKKTINAALYVSDDGEEKKLDGETFEFSSLDETVATVSASGEITPVAVGTTEIIISANGVNAYVTADVYTAAITTPFEWLAMFEEDEKHDDRYYLENDIDFVGVTYDLGRDVSIFSAEVNGNYHTVKNVAEWRDKRYSDPTRDALQSLFGADLFGARISNISFKNSRFTKSDCAVIADSVRMHPGNYQWGDKLYETKLYNVNIEASYAVDGSGLFKTVYGGSMENVFAYLHKNDGSAFGSNFTCVVKEDYLNWGLGTSTFENVVVYVDGGTKWEKNPSSVGITVKNSFISATRQDALYRAFTTLDKRVWKLTEKNLPELTGGL